jgi:hypothetical protein
MACVTSPGGAGSCETVPKYNIPRTEAKVQLVTVSFLLLKREIEAKLNVLAYVY